MAKTYTRLSIEYLGGLGFKAFNEGDHMIAYSYSKDNLYIGFEHHNWDIHSDECYCDYWIIMIRHGSLLLKDECNTVERFKEILDFFKIETPAE